MIDSEKFEKFKDFEFSDVFIRAWNIIGFTAQKWSNDDSLEQKDTAVFFYYPDEPIDEMWAVRYLGETTGVHGCATFLPNERWVFLAEDGEVYVVGMGDDDWENPVSQENFFFFNNVKSISNGHAIAVGPKRQVYMRESASVWKQLKNGLFPQGDDTDLEYAGFRDIDGYSEQDIYACGGRGDVWHYDGSQWRYIEVPVNSSLENICCADDGFVYITTNRREILRGRMDNWMVIQQDLTTEIFESIVKYNDQVIVSTVSSLYVVSEKFEQWDSGIPKMESKAHIASGDGVLVVAGRNEAVMYDGKIWKTVL